MEGVRFRLRRGPIQQSVLKSPQGEEPPREIYLSGSGLDGDGAFHPGRVVARHVAAE